MSRAALQVVAVSLALMPALAMAQVLPALPYQAVAPTAPASPLTQSPVQQQVLENYRTQLLQTQREMLQANPSGLGREQVQLGHQLNTYSPGYVPPPPSFGSSTPPSSPGFNVAPSPTAVLPTPPFNAAPQP